MEKLNLLEQQKLGDDHVQKSLLFIQSHESLLRNIEGAIRETASEGKDHHIKPIKISTEQLERVYAQDLISTENEDVRKALTVLVYLCDEISQLKDIAESKFYRPLLIFGQNALDPTGGSDSEDKLTISKEKMIGKILPFLQELSNFIDRCYAVTVNLIQQLASLFNPKSSLYRTTFKHTHLPTAYYSVAKVLTVLMTLDAIIQQNDILLSSWSSYKVMISYIRADPSSFNTTHEGIEKFERLLVSIDQNLMSGDILNGCIEQNFEEAFEDDSATPIFISVRENNTFMSGEFLYNIKQVIEASPSVVGTHTEMTERFLIMGCFGTYALYRRLLPANQQPDVKLHKLVWGLQKVVPNVVLSDGVLWLPAEFLMKHVPFSDLKKLDPPAPELFRQQYIQQFDQQLSQRTLILVSQCKAWMILSESKLQASLKNNDPSSSSSSSTSSILELFASIALKGLSLARRASFLAKSCLIMHYTMQVPLSKNNLHDISQILESLKAIEYSFARKDRVLTEKLVHVVHNIENTIASITYPIRKKLESGVKLNNTQLVEYSLIVSIEDLIRSTDSFSVSRQVTLSLLIDIVTSGTLVFEKDAIRLKNASKKLIALSSLSRDIVEACDTAYLYNHTVLLPTLVKVIYDLPTECNRLQYIYSSYEDGFKLCDTVLHSDNNKLFFLNYRSILTSILRKCIIEPLCSDIETDLRLHIHTNYLDHMQAVNPKTENLKPLRPFLDLSPLRILGLVIDIKTEVTHYLDMNFYNLTTVALHDWRTYSDMRSLALEKLGFFYFLI
jgi:WASH complex subunit 7